MLKQKRTWIGLAFILFTFYFLFRNIDKDKFLAALAHFQLIWLVPALSIYMFGYVIRGFRWVVLLSPIKKCKFTSLFPTLIVGFMANNVLPARAGEFIRAHLNGTKEGISRSASFATIILERLFDGLTMIILLWASLSLGHLPIQESTMPASIQHAIDWSPWVFGSAFLILFGLLLFKELAIKVIGFFISLAPSKFHEPMEKLAHTFIDGLTILKSAKESILVLTFSLVAWACEFTSYYFFGVGMGIAPSPLTLWSSALLMAIVNLGILIPNAPGGIGLFEFIGVALLLPFGVQKETAVGYMFLVHFLVLIPITLLGFYFYRHEHIQLNAIEKDDKPAPRTKKTLRPKKRKVSK
ncbi:MAG TPA: lysylphosphatidylglycerol synthase transmembrane domain-containing protein [bacterium]|nr:lysylphosphatidylglycerol synthase transmembrane domain-containing protein [bacterium]